MSRTQILALGVDKVTMAQAVDLCLTWTDGDQSHLVVTPNAEHVYLAVQDPAFAAIENGADLVIPDGIGVLMASRILGDPVPEKVAGVELSTNIIAEMSKRGRGSVYLLGGRPEVVAEAARRLKERFPGVTIAGHQHGYYKPDEEQAVIAAIAAARPDLLVVGMGMPKQEQWLAAHLRETGAKVGIGAGGTIDVWAGAAPRAPEWMIKGNLEWLFRIVKLGRYSRSLPPLAKFILLVMAQKVRGR
ncbi:MAG TPA: WecB/TagA/CpsF family glycosyltransferase [Symbiobacteriaceae bacterium]|jgi:N-acetylglucosaminyldiphosphoundecaprenol N-acetyl-beta-D-mannosaminyltransferase|nr:WecB/TagA/CpsF family glycosyltransferase [Symbiobacteriaceae bacterium]